MTFLIVIQAWKYLRQLQRVSFNEFSGIYVTTMFRIKQWIFGIFRQKKNGFEYQEEIKSIRMNHFFLFLSFLFAEKFMYTRNMYT